MATAAEAEEAVVPSSRPKVSIVYELDYRPLEKADKATQCSGNEATVQVRPPLPACCHA